MKYTYFVSYHYKEIALNPQSGFGSNVITLNWKIESRDDLFRVQQRLGSDLGEYYLVVLLNFQLLSEEQDS